jgi:hypothetical protein
MITAVITGRQPMGIASNTSVWEAITKSSAFRAPMITSANRALWSARSTRSTASSSTSVSAR